MIRVGCDQVAFFNEFKQDVPQVPADAFRDV